MLSEKLKFGKPKIERPRVMFPVKIVYVWILVFAGMAIYAIGWYTLGTVALAVIQAIENSFNFPPPWDSVTAFIKNCVYFHPIISLVGWMIWGFLQSTRKNAQSWEQG